MNNDAKKRNIANIKEKIRFEIPPYQRLYEWEKEQIETLLEDVRKACFNANGEPQNKIYFIGNVVVSEENGKYILIDGQQRLTTLFLIGIYLASKKEIENNPWLGFVKSDKKLRISMPLRENEEKWLSELIDETKGKGFKEDLKTSSEIHQKIADGLKTIRTWFEQKCKEKEERENFSNFLYHNVYFALVELAKDTDLNQFFVRMNNRGKQLEKHEILKARLLNVIKNEEDWKTYAKIWDLCSDMDKYIFQSASDRNFLRDLKGESDNQSEKTLCAILQDIKEGDKGNNGGNSKDDDDLEKVKSIIDFPTFLLHVAKLMSSDKDISINKDKLLEIIIESESMTKKQEATLLLDSKGEVKGFILAMLRYRILFDYFVIKRIVDENLSKSGEYSIRGLTKNDKGYYSIGGSVMEDLAMIQNYLRVARAGDRQNYHHWLTPFLKKASEVQEIEIEQKGDGFQIRNFFKKENMKEIGEWLIIKEGNTSPKREGRELICFLENLDTDLAIEQTKEKGGSEKGLLEIANKWLKNGSIPESIGEGDFERLASNLNKGTGTPHYWFYRLEYYLWKKREEREGVIMQIDGKKIKFGTIANNYRFRGLNSIEHIQPQSKEEKGWEGKIDGSEDRKIDCFGNLALISQSFNSSLSNQDSEDKSLDLQKKINKEDVESLKLWLAFVKIKNNENKWVYGDKENEALKHQEEMLKILKASLGIDVKSEEQPLSSQTLQIRT